MKFIIKIVRNSITRAIHRQRQLAAHSVRFEPYSYALQTYNPLATFHYKNFIHDNSNNLIQPWSKYKFQTKGLLDLGNLITLTNRSNLNSGPKAELNRKE